MPMTFRPTTVVLWLLAVIQTPVFAAPKLDFNRDIRPILSDNRFACHGPDTQKVKGGLRLDYREAALKPAKSGALALVPGKPDRSALVQRIGANEEPPSAPSRSRQFV